MTLEGIERAPESTARVRAPWLPIGDHWALTMGALSVSVVGFSLSTTLLLPVLPAIQDRFGTTNAASSWVITVYMLVAAVANPVVGRIGDLVGRRRTLLVALMFLVVGAVGATLATTIGGLIGARALQGVGGAVLPLSFGVVRDQVPIRRRPVAIATIGAMTAVGGGVGLPLGGLLVEHGSVDLVLSVVLGLTVLAFVTATIFVPESTHRAQGRLDVPGALLLACAVVTPLLGVALGATTGWRQPWTPVLVVFGLGAAVVWWHFEAHQTDPLVDTRVLRRRPVLLTNMVTILMALGLFGAFSLIPVLVQRSESSGGLGLDAAAAGLLMLPCAALTFVTAPTVGFVIRRWGAKVPLVASCVTVAIGLVVLGVAQIGPPQLAVLSGLLGIGFGVLTATAPNLIVASVREDETGAQTGVNTMVQNLGTSLGSQLSAVLMAAVASSGARLGSQLSLGVCAGAILCAALAALFIEIRIAPGAP